MSIYKKLLAFQKLNISVIKDGKNPHFKSNYATLNEVLDKVKKPLNDLGVLITFTPQECGLTTSLIDVDSETSISSFMSYVGCENAQKLLACNTYFRRGSLVSLLGLEDEDDDGNKASESAKKPYLNESSDAFIKAKEFIAKGGTVADIQKKYSISESVLKQLTQ
jgi:hypothetical protein